MTVPLTTYLTQKLKKGNDTRALKIFYTESQIKEGFLREETEGLGSSTIKNYLDKAYDREAKALETVKSLGSEYIVCPLFRMLVAFAGVHDGLCPQCRYYGEYKNGDIRGFILEYCEGIDLYEHLRKRGTFSEQNVREFMR